METRLINRQIAIGGRQEYLVEDTAYDRLRCPAQSIGVERRCGIAACQCSVQGCRTQAIVGTREVAGLADAHQHFGSPFVRKVEPEPRGDLPALGISIDLRYRPFVQEAVVDLVTRTGKPGRPNEEGVGLGDSQPRAWH